MPDKTLTCNDCGREFTFTASEQEFFTSKGFSNPTRCPDCRAARKAQREERQLQWWRQQLRWWWRQQLRRAADVPCGLPRSVARIPKYLSSPAATGLFIAPTAIASSRAAPATAAVLVGAPAAEQPLRRPVGPEQQPLLVAVAQ